MLKERGVSQILFKEDTVASLENAGVIEVALGTDVQRLEEAGDLPADLPVNENNY